LRLIFDSKKQGVRTVEEMPPFEIAALPFPPHPMPEIDSPASSSISLAIPKGALSPTELF
jgi:hypothetical protein